MVLEVKVKMENWMVLVISMILMILMILMVILKILIGMVILMKMMISKMLAFLILMILILIVIVMVTLILMGMVISKVKVILMVAALMMHLYNIFHFGVLYLMSPKDTKVGTLRESIRMSPYNYYCNKVFDTVFGNAGNVCLRNRGNATAFVKVQMRYPQTVSQTLVDQSGDLQQR